MKYLLLLSALLGLPLTSHAQTSDFKPMIVGALTSASGSVSETFPADTQWVRVMRQRYGTPGPITVTTRVLKRFHQEGCGRIQVDYLVHEANVVKRSASGLEDASFGFQLNVCKDGTPPIEGMDLRDLQQSVTPTPKGLSPSRVKVLEPGKYQASSSKQKADDSSGGQ